jgi:hypothetical protein
VNVCCQAQVPATGRSLVQRIHTECGVSVGSLNLNSEAAKARVGMLRHRGARGINSNYFFVRINHFVFAMGTNCVRQELKFMHSLDECHSSECERNY